MRSSTALPEATLLHPLPTASTASTACTACTACTAAVAAAAPAAAAATTATTLSTLSPPPLTPPPPPQPEHCVASHCDDKVSKAWPAFKLATNKTSSPCKPAKKAGIPLCRGVAWWLVLPQAVRGLLFSFFCHSISAIFEETTATMVLDLDDTLPHPFATSLRKAVFSLRADYCATLDRSRRAPARTRDPPAPCDGPTAPHAWPSTHQPCQQHCMLIRRCGWVHACGSGAPATRPARRSRAAKHALAPAAPPQPARPTLGAH